MMYGRLPVLQILRLPASNPVVEPGIAAGMSGFSRGLSQAMAMKQAAAKNALLNQQAQMAAMRAGYLPQQMADAHAQAVARNALLGAQTGYEGEMAQYLPSLDNAKLGLMQQQAAQSRAMAQLDPLMQQLLAAQTAYEKGLAEGLPKQQAAKLAQTAAQTASIQANTAAIPKKLALQQQQNKLKQQFTTAYNDRTKSYYMAPPVKGAVVAANPAAFAAVPGSSGQPSPDAVKNVERTDTLKVNQDLAPKQVQQQVAGGIELMNYIHSPTYQNLKAAAAPYAQAFGKGAGAVQGLLRTDPQALAKYKAFVNQAKLFMASRIVKLEGMNSTNEQREEANKIFDNAMNNTSNPQQFMLQMNLLEQNLDQIDKGVMAADQPVYKVSPLLASNNNAPVSAPSGFKAPAGMVGVRSPDGRIGWIPSSQLKIASAAGYKEVS